MTPTLYLTRNGLLEPLGQSQELAYLRGLFQQHCITLITYEEDTDWADAPHVAALREQCERLQIRWLPHRFWPSPTLLAPALSMVRMVWLAAREVRQQRAGLIHARSYIPAALALFVGRITGVPFIFVSANVSAAPHWRHTLGSWALLPAYLFWTFRKSFLVMQALKARAQDFSIDKAVDQYEALLFPTHSPRAAA